MGSTLVAWGVQFSDSVRTLRRPFRRGGGPLIVRPFRVVDLEKNLDCVSLRSFTLL